MNLINKIIKESFNILTKFIFSVFFSVFFLTTISAQLSYAEGGSAVEDPGANLNVNLRRYVDAVSGDDNNDGKSPANAWRTQGKVSSMKSNFQPGTHVFFKRGQSWSGGLDFRSVNGSSTNRIVLGTYGLPLSAKANIQGTVNLSKSSYLMMREFDCIK